MALLLGADALILGAIGIGFGSDGGNSIVTLVIITASAVIGGGVLMWMRQRPIDPDDPTLYPAVTAQKAMGAAIPTFAGFVVAIVTGPAWAAFAGALPSLAMLPLLWPSPDDLERHQLLYLA